MSGASHRCPHTCRCRHRAFRGSLQRFLEALLGHCSGTMRREVVAALLLVLFNGNRATFRCVGMVSGRY